MRFLILAVTLILVACASTTEPRLLRVRSLAVPIDLPQSTTSNGSIDGLERLPKDPDGKIRANVLFVHGIGWTQDKDKPDFARDFIVAISNAYGVKPPEPGQPMLCPRSSFTGPNQKGAGLRIVDQDGLRVFYTDYARHRSASTDIACVDKQLIDLGERGSIAVYRVLWDDTLYNAYEYPQIGYDDALAPGMAPPQGYEDIDKLRSKNNRELKTSVVTYGLSDAAMYLGPIGSLLRSAISAGLCAAFDDAAGLSTIFAQIASTSAPVRRSASDICGSATAGSRPAFAIVSESLGSRAVYDVLTDPLQESPGPSSDKVRTESLRRLGLTANERVEVFLLANQIPLLGVGRLAQVPRLSALPKPVRFVAISEINDLLTFELVPYFEHLFMERCRTYATSASVSEPGCATATVDQLAHQLSSDSSVRARLLADLGFEVVDVRVKFAGPVSVFTPELINPLDAHTKHMTVPLIRDLIVCGVQDGNPLPRKGLACLPGNTKNNAP